MTEESFLEKHESMGQDCYIAAAAIAGGASLIGGVTSAIGSSNAAGAQSAAAQQAAQIQQQEQQQNQQNQQPYMTAGTNALQTIGQDQANGTGFAAGFNPSTYIDTPGYQFQLQQGENAIQSSAAATGGALNGGTLKALDQYTTGLANTTYGTAYNQYLQNSQQQYNQLYGVANLGENAASSVGQQGVTSANNAGNYLTQAGNAQAAGDVGVANGINSAVGGVANAANTAAVLQGLQSQSSYTGPPLQTTSIASTGLIAPQSTPTYTPSSGVSYSPNSDMQQGNPAEAL